MSLNIGDAISTGVEKVTTTAGVQLGALYVVAVVLTTVGSQSITAAFGPEVPRAGRPALALPIGVAGGVVVMLIGFLIAVVLSVIVFRTVAHDTSALDSIPAGVTEALPTTVLYLAVAGIIQGILVVLGLVLLVIPGLFVLVSLYFSQVYIAVEGEGPIEGLKSSWGLAKGDRLRVFGLVIVIAVVGVLTSMIGELVGVASPLLGSLASLVASGFLTVFTSAALVDAYYQLDTEQERQEALLQQPE